MFMKGNDKVRVVLVGPHSLPHGGIQKYLEQLTYQLSTKGYAYNVLNTRSKRDVSNNSGFIKAFQGIVKYLFLMLKLQKIEGTIVHCFSSSYSNFFANGLLLISGKISRRNTIISMLGGGFPSVVRNSGFMRKFLIRTIFEFIDQIIVCNKRIKESVISLGIKSYKIFVISNALPFKITTNDILESNLRKFIDLHSPFVTSVGALLPEYGLSTLLEAVSKLKVEFPNLGLLLIVLTVSNKRTSDEIHHIISTNKLYDNVLIAKDIHSVHAIIKKSDLFVRSTFLDGDSMSVREALFLGTPVIASDTAYRPKDVILFKRADSNDLYQKMHQVLKNPGSFVPKYASIEAYDNLKTIEKIYRSLNS